MNASNHAAVKMAAAAGGIAVILAIGEAANLASRALGVRAGVAVIGAMFAACWIFFRVRPALHPVRQARTCEPEPAALAEDRQSARVAA